MPAPPADDQEAPVESPVRTLNVRLPTPMEPQGETGGTGMDWSAGETEPAHAASAGDAHQRAAGREEAEYVAAIEDYVLSVAADGTTTARPSKRHGGESPLGDSEAGIRAHHGAPSVASARAPRHKPSTPPITGPWDDHAHSGSDTAMIQGKAAAQVPFNAETTDIKGIARMIVRLRDAQMHGQQT